MMATSFEDVIDFCKVKCLRRIACRSSGHATPGAVSVQTSYPATWLIRAQRSWHLTNSYIHQIRPSAPSSVISRPICFSSSLRCRWHVGSAPFVRRRCDCLASSAPFTNIQTYLLTYDCNFHIDFAAYLS